VQLTRHASEEVRSFATLLSTRPEITSAWIMTGEADYLLRVYCPDLRALNTLIHDVILAHPIVERVHSQIVMDQPKADAPLPVL
jgi:DNA-binding Lrp family transcriptional regulator